MANHDPAEDIRKQTTEAETIDSQELSEEDLKPVSGGIGSFQGNSLGSFDTAVCISN